MKLAISNIAWDQKDNEEIYSLMKENGFRGLEIAPTKIWNNIDNISIKEINRFHKNLKKFDIKPAAMQSLLYGKSDLIVWGSSKTREETIKYLSKIIKIAEMLGVQALIFGSPKNRIIPDSSNRQELDKIGNDFFYSLAKIASNYNTKICLEPNPVDYGTNFLNTTREAIDFVKNINHDALRVNLDTGTIILNGERDYEYLANNSKYIGHIHISEPFLKTINLNNVIHRRVKALVDKIKYAEWISVEMKQQNDNDVFRVSEVLEYVRNLYS